MVASSVSPPEVDLWEMMSDTKEVTSECVARENEQLIVSDLVSPGCTEGSDDVSVSSEFTWRSGVVER